MERKTASIIVLSGGTSKRFGSDKSLAKIVNKRLIDFVVSAIPPDFEIIIVGPDPQILTASYMYMLEHPAGGGPVAGIEIALQHCSSELIAVIATDMPFVMSHMLHLLRAFAVNDEAVMYKDSDGFQQPLAAFYRRDALENAIHSLIPTQGRSMRELLAQLKIHDIPMSAEVEKAFIDIDTPEDFERAVQYFKTL